MINLKEAFTYRKFLDEKMTDLSRLCMYDTAFCIFNKKHLRSKAVEGAWDEEFSTKDGTLSMGRGEDYVAQVDSDVLLKALDLLANEICSVDESIFLAKVASAGDIDLLITQNKQVRKIINVLKFALRQKPSEDNTFGIDYKLDVDGKQVEYRFPVKIVKTIDFDRKKLKKKAEELEKFASDISYKIDELMLTIKVNHDPMFDKSDTMDDIIEAVKNS